MGEVPAELQERIDAMPLNELTALILQLTDEESMRDNFCDLIYTNNSVEDIEEALETLSE